jgi:hypothetical protein
VIFWVLMPCSVVMYHEEVASRLLRKLLMLCAATRYQNPGSLLLNQKSQCVISTWLWIGCCCSVRVKIWNAADKSTEFLCICRMYSKSLQAVWSSSSGGGGGVMYMYVCMYISTRHIFTVTLPVRAKAMWKYQTVLFSAYWLRPPPPFFISFIYQWVCWIITYGLCGSSILRKYQSQEICYWGHWVDSVSNLIIHLLEFW